LIPPGEYAAGSSIARFATSFFLFSLTLISLLLTGITFRSYNYNNYVNLSISGID